MRKYHSRMSLSADRSSQRESVGMREINEEHGMKKSSHLSSTATRGMCGGGSDRNDVSSFWSFLRAWIFAIGVHSASVSGCQSLSEQRTSRSDCQTKTTPCSSRRPHAGSRLLTHNGALLRLARRRRSTSTHNTHPPASEDNRPQSHHCGAASGSAAGPAPRPARRAEGRPRRPFSRARRPSRRSGGVSARTATPPPRALYRCRPRLASAQPRGGRRG